MGIYLNPGNGNFQMAVNSEIYVDKTMLISETNRLIETLQRFVCISRPRRFGKSIAADMLVAYYGKGCDSSALFGSFKIADTADYVRYLNQYDVIALNMQSFLSMTSDVDEMIALIQEEVLNELTEYYPGILPGSAKYLSIGLEKIYSKTQKGFIFVIDEWDCMLRNRNYSAKDQEKYLDFIRNLLKDKAYVSLAYMTGILPIKKYGTHSALNMFTEYSMTESRQFAEYVGFTEKEVISLCKKYHMDYEKMHLWYDGYTLPKAGHVYNPKSVVEALLSGRCSGYWTRTETYEALKIYIELDFDGLKEAVIRMLAGERIRINIERFQNDMTSFSSKDDVCTLLIHLGYLAFDLEHCTVYIPNREIMGEFQNAIEGAKWTETIRVLEQSEHLLQATWNMDEKEVARLIDIAHSENTSILNYNDENALSFVVSLAYFNSYHYYVRFRELPSGKGYADIVYLPKKNISKPALVVELKYDKSADSAISQIKEKRYVESLQRYTGEILLVGINYDKETKQHACRIEKCVQK